MQICTVTCVLQVAEQVDPNARDYSLQYNLDLKEQAEKDPTKTELRSEVLKQDNIQGSDWLVETQGSGQV